MDLIITNKQKINVKVQPKDANNKPVTLTVKPTWTRQAGNATVQVADDGLSAWLISSDTEGDSLFEVRDLTPGSTAVDSIKLHVDNSGTPPPSTIAVTLGLVADPAIDK